MKRATALVALATMVATLALTAAGTWAAHGADDDGLQGVLSAEFDAFAVRVEYDIPLPASTGTIPHVVGEARRSEAGENAKGLAAAPTHLDAVVGGKYYDPNGDGQGDNLPPQVECFYPGALVDTKFGFPTDTRNETKGVPATAYATAQCSAGPTVQLRSSGVAGDLPSVSVHDSAADGNARPVKNRLGSDASARASGISLAGGAITVGSVEAAGASSVTGKPGNATTDARIVVNDIVAGGVHFSVANDRLVVGGQEVAIDSAQAQSTIDAANAALKPLGTGCRIDVTTRPDSYPQGYLLGRKPPVIGLSADGRTASSMRAGVQVLCDLPHSITDPSGFSPQRMQVILGFVYTGAFASDEPGGFGLGDLGGSLSDASFGPALPSSAITAGPADVVAPPLAAAPAVSATPAPAAPDAGPASPPRTRTVTRYRTVAAMVTPMAGASRAALALACLAVFALLTHLGLRRLRGVTEP
ncbi:MAG TPA: hypothetical protein VHN98_11385 [Acidimicrobiales bacterium]|nr:hypothetical protein [Acidimicrobiales bacterium]